MVWDQNIALKEVDKGCKYCLVGIRSVSVIVAVTIMAAQA